MPESPQSKGGVQSQGPPSGLPPGLWTVSGPPNAGVHHEDPSHLLSCSPHLCLMEVPSTLRPSVPSLCPPSAHILTRTPDTPNGHWETVWRGLWGQVTWGQILLPTVVTLALLHLHPLHFCVWKVGESQWVCQGGCRAIAHPFRALVARACNPSFSGCRDQEDHGSKADRANSL
jgi:hypothetical protein